MAGLFGSFCKICCCLDSIETIMWKRNRAHRRGQEVNCLVEIDRKDRWMCTYTCLYFLDTFHQAGLATRRTAHIARQLSSAESLAQ